MNISLAVATHNEAENIRTCIESCRDLVNEVVVVDGASTDRTVEIARELGARVIEADNPQMFHINKQKAIDACTGEWILQLDADERVTPELAGEIRRVVHMGHNQLMGYQRDLPEKDLFIRHQEVSGGGLSHFLSRQGSPKGVHAVGIPENSTPATHAPINAFYIPRLNYFLGTYLRHGGVYPDGVIRLFRKGKAHLPCKSVHELMKVEGETGWLQYPLLHIDSPNFKRYLERNSRYIDHLVADMKKDKIPADLLHFVDYMLLKPLSWFFMATIRHKGILDGWQGIVFSFYSALRFPRGWMRYVKKV